MKPIEDLLHAFEQHYSTRDYQLGYTQTQRAEMVAKYGWVSQSYMAVLYDEVVSKHPMSLRSLPDMAVIVNATQSMDRPEVYAQPVIAIEDKTEQVHESIREHLNAEAKRNGEPNHEERERIRAKVAKNQATPHEAFWIKVIDGYNGDWRKAVSAEGVKV